MPTSIKSAFRPNLVLLDPKNLLPSRELDARERHHEKYKQIAASIGSIGVIEPLVVFPSHDGKYRVLDGHKRLDILRQRKERQVECLLSTDDESYTYNRRVNYLSPVSEHHMILRALEHNSEERIANALNVDVATIRRKCNLLNGVCKEAIDILRDRRVNSKAFAVLKKMKPVRQIEAAQLMVASNMYSGRFAAALLAGTKDEMLVTSEKNLPTQSVPATEKMRMERETDRLLHDLKGIEESYGSDALTLSIWCRYLSKLLANVPIRQYLSEHHPDVCHELESLLTLVGSDVRRGGGRSAKGVR